MPPVRHSIADMAREFTVNRHELRGFLRGRRIETFRGPKNAICVDSAGYREVKREYSRRPRSGASSG